MRRNTATRITAVVVSALLILLPFAFLGLLPYMLMSWLFGIPVITAAWLMAARRTHR